MLAEISSLLQRRHLNTVASEINGVFRLTKHMNTRPLPVGGEFSSQKASYVESVSMSRRPHSGLSLQPWSTTPYGWLSRVIIMITGCRALRGNSG